MINSRFLAVAGAVAGAFVASQAFAHADLVSSNPAADATVAAPKTITLTFSDRLVPTFSGFELVMPQHNNMKVQVRIALSTDGKTIIGTPQAALMKGDYTINWRAASADGHRMTGKVSFKVN